jgi:hypothetical protein
MQPSVHHQHCIAACVCSCCLDLGLVLWSWGRQYASSIRLACMHNMYNCTARAHTLEECQNVMTMLLVRSALWFMHDSCPLHQRFCYLPTAPAFPPVPAACMQDSTAHMVDHNGAMSVKENMHALKEARMIDRPWLMHKESHCKFPGPKYWS